MATGTTPFWVDEVTLALVVGDVVGHGLHAATAMGQLRTVVRSCAESGVGPAGVLGRVDRFVRRRGSPSRVRGTFRLS